MSAESCPYKNIFGKPREGAHAYRVFDIAVVDVVCTLALGIALAYAFNWNTILTCVVLFLLGIAAHRAFCVRTRVDELLFS